MRRSDFRIKLDFYKYYQDVRRFCWVFVDGEKMLHVGHLKAHITERFHIKDPFHLLLYDSEYLPAEEDIRILKENERIVVSPGTGIANSVDVLCHLTLLEKENVSKKDQKLSCDTHHKEVQTVDIFPECESVVSAKQQEVSQISIDYCQTLTDASSTNDIVFHTAIEETVPQDTADIVKVDNDPKEESHTKENLLTIPKRKRVKRSRAKISKATKETETCIENQHSPPKKPKVVSTCIIANKHIRFETDTENTSNSKLGSQREEQDDSFCDKTYDKLSALLSLANQSTPLTFMNQSSRKNESGDLKDSSVSTDSQRDGIKTGAPFSSLDITKYPVMTAKPKVNDTISFRMLNMADDYTPEISGSIIAKVQSCSNSGTYDLRIIHGAEEVQTPSGKLSLDQDAEFQESDIVTLEHQQLIEPRLITGIANRDCSTA